MYFYPHEPDSSASSPALRVFLSSSLLKIAIWRRPKSARIMSMTNGLCHTVLLISLQNFCVSILWRLASRCSPFSSVPNMRKFPLAMVPTTMESRRKQCYATLEPKLLRTPSQTANFLFKPRSQTPLLTTTCCTLPLLLKC